jgi:hypothetical protein
LSDSLPRRYSHKSRAQKFGESVYIQTKSFSKNEKKKIDSIANLILNKMAEMENNNETN